VFLHKQTQITKVLGCAVVSFGDVSFLHLGVGFAELMSQTQVAEKSRVSQRRREASQNTFNLCFILRKLVAGVQIICVESWSELAIGRDVHVAAHVEERRIVTQVAISLVHALSKMAGYVRVNRW
jgi:hypothetical protein